MKIDSIIFDLDGTLWDTGEACAVSWNNVARRNRIQFRDITAGDVQRVAGKPHVDCIKEIFAGLTPAQIDLIARETVEEDNLMVREIGGLLYDGVKEGLVRLAAKYPLFIVSNCQAGYIETFLELNALRPAFKDFECWGNTGESKTMNLKSLIGRNALEAPIYVGDAEGDWKAARDCGVPFAFVSYGFGQVPGFEQSFGSFQELESAFTQLTARSAE